MADEIAVHAICIESQDNRLLLVLKYDQETKTSCWTLPGGKVNGNESLTDTLHRELDKELKNGVFEIKGTFSPKIFRGEASFSKKSVEVHMCKVVCKDGKKMIANQEIEAFCWISLLQASNIIIEKMFGDEQGSCHPVSSITRDILEHLLNKGKGFIFMM